MSGYICAYIYKHTIKFLVLTIWCAKQLFSSNVMRLLLHSPPKPFTTPSRNSTHALLTPCFSSPSSPTPDDRWSTLPVFQFTYSRCTMSLDLCHTCLFVGGSLNLAYCPKVIHRAAHTGIRSPFIFFALCRYTIYVYYSSDNRLLALYDFCVCVWVLTSVGGGLYLGVEWFNHLVILC